MKKILKRLKLPTPEFWKKVSAFGLSLGTAASVGVVIPNTPNWFEEIMQQGIGIGFAISIVARLAVYDKDKPLLHDNDLKNKELPQDS